MVKKTEKYKSLKLVEAFAPTEGRTFALRLYRTSMKPVASGYRYHFGFARAMVEGLRVVLESPAGWGRPHWAEEKGFWIWSTTSTGAAPDRAALNRELRGMIEKFNRFAVASKKITGGD